MGTQRVALVTGANRGIGLEISRQLAMRGVLVYLGCRNEVAGENAVAELKEVGIENVRFINLDVTDSANCKAAATRIEGEVGHLDILVNNAGVLLDRGMLPSQTPMEMWRSTFDINFFGLIEVTRSFLPLVLKSEDGRIINLTSILASCTWHADPSSPIYESKSASYNVSKTAVNAWTIHLAWELKDTKVKVNAADPGWVKTDMGGPNATLELEEGAKTVIALALDADVPTGTYQHLGKLHPW